MKTKCCVVGIAGGSASGKTSLAGALKHYLQEKDAPSCVEVIGTDTFYHADKSRGPTFVSPSRAEEYFNFNHPDALDLERLCAHLDARSTGEEAPRVLLVEGLMVLHMPQIRNRLNLRVFVELEADVRALRRLLRDSKGGRGSTDPEWIASYYLESARVGHELFIEPSRIHADLIVRGDANFSRLVPLLGAVVTSALSSEKESPR